MIRYIIRMIMRKELNKINASGEAQFIDILCNKYNDGKEFKGIGQHLVYVDLHRCRETETTVSCSVI